MAHIIVLTARFKSMDENILFIDKLAGITSHDVVNKVRKMTGEKHVGHTGTLDPLATGLLIVLVGRNATKRQSEFLHLDKVYECTAQLGVTTDTYDIEGKIVSQSEWAVVEKISEKDVKHALKKFTGKIQQQVPAYSAVKVNGHKLYEKARQGVLSIERPIRVVEIFSSKLNGFSKSLSEKNATFTFTIHCSSGTYIRSLVHDVGEELKIGATVTQLRRTKIGNFTVSGATVF